MRRRPFQIVGSLFLLAAVISAAGCGGGGGSKTTTTTTTTTTAAAPPTTTAQTTPTTATTTKTAGSGLGALASVENCKQLANLGEAFAQALQGASGNVQKELAVFQQFAAKTPSDIRPSFEVIANALAKASSALKGVSTSGGTPSASDLAKLSQLASTLNGPDIKQAETKIQQWAATNCHA